MREIDKPPRMDVKKAITRFLTTADIVLTADQEKTLARWEMADHLLRAHTDHSDIILKITGKYGVSKFVAENDISAAMEVFARSRKINKKYVVALNLERLNRFIAHIESQVYAPDESKRLKMDAKTMIAMAKLFETYTYTANSLPETPDRRPSQAPIFMFNLPAGVTMPAVIPLDQAIRDADEIISDIDFENTATMSDDTTSTNNPG